MSSPTSFFRRPTYRPPSPPTWLCYEQIPEEDSEYSESESESDGDSDASHGSEERQSAPAPRDDDTHNMDIDEAGDSEKHDSQGGDEDEAQRKRDLKGKGRAVEPLVQSDEEMASPRKKVEKVRERRRRRQPTYNPRPILTIQKSQGFVWNQDLFVPPYIKDRYVASASPSNGRGFVPGSWSSTDSSLGGYEIEVVEIRVKEGEFDSILSR